MSPGASETDRSNDQAGKIARLLIRLSILLAPLLLTPAIGYMLAEGILNLGGGEKDIIFLIPWFVWSVLFVISGLALWRKKTMVSVWLIHTTAWSFGVIFVLWSLLFIYSMLITH